MKTYKALVAGLTAGALTLVSCTPTQQAYNPSGVAAPTTGALQNSQSQPQNTVTPAPPSVSTPPAPTPPPAPVPAGRAPAAFPTETPGIVISPHKPYNKVNVKGMPVGQLVTDPYTNKRFTVPQ